MSGDWWESVVLLMFGAREWCDLEKDTFDYLCTQLTPYMHYDDTHQQKVVSVKKPLVDFSMVCCNNHLLVLSN